MILFCPVEHEAEVGISVGIQVSGNDWQLNFKQEQICTKTVLVGVLLDVMLHCCWAE